MMKRATELVIGSAAAALDRAVNLAAHAEASSLRSSSPHEALSHADRMRLLGAMAEHYGPDVRAQFFRESRAILPAERVVRSGRDQRVIDVSWPSDYSPLLAEVGSRYGRYLENHIAAARLFLTKRPRPIAVLLHGYMAGHFALEQRVWPIEWFSNHGFDVALFVLPFHGVRAVAGQRVPPFPGPDPRITNEGFRQTMADLADFMRWLRERGHPSVGLSGMSLGGYTTALAATLHPELAFAIPIIPLASIADFARDQGRLGSEPSEVALQHRALDAVYEIISPLHRQPLLGPERMLIVAGKADRITPISHAIRLSRHFGARLETMPGGHLLQVGRSESFRRIGELLDRLGVARAS